MDQLSQWPELVAQDFWDFLDQLARPFSHFSLLTADSPGVTRRYRFHMYRGSSDHPCLVGGPVFDCLLLCKKRQKDSAIKKSVPNSVSYAVREIPSISCAMDREPNRTR